MKIKVKPNHQGAKTPFISQTKNERAITLIALIISIIILVILAAVSINAAFSSGILDTATKGVDSYITAQEKEQDEFNNADNIIKETTNSNVPTNKNPTFEIKITKTDGTELAGDETKKLVTINITNIAEVGENYTIEVKTSNGNILTKEANVVGDGQASYIINKSGNYTITVTAIKDGTTKTTTKTENIKVAKVQIAESEVDESLKANGVIDIVWLDMENNVIDTPMSPANYLCGLTPIKYNKTTNAEETVSNPTTDTNWYNYEAQTGNTEKGGTSKWANARSSNSNAYFVWIPRYAYKITYFDTADNANAYRTNKDSTVGIIGYSNNEGIIAITDGTEKLLTGSEPTNVVGTVQTSEYVDYIVHPAFQFGDGATGIKAGIWVGKFESTGDISEIKIIPNATTLEEHIDEIFTGGQGVKNTYNLTGDSHMMKNTEWGAVAYLAESKYGRNGTEVSINSTGTSGGTNSLESTTGNIYGIYDMNGNGWEFVAGILGSRLSEDSFYDFTGIDSKYYNVYTNYNESKKIKGDGIYETSTAGSGTTSWHEDQSVFVNTTYPLMLRGR